MPAPLFPVFPEMVELLSIRVPAFQIPPPKLLLLVAVFPEIVELETLRMPELLKAPPLLEVLAPETVTPEIARLPPEAMSKILKLRLVLPLSPLMVSEKAPGPVMVSEPALEVAAIVGSAACRVMVVMAPFVNSEEAKIISSLAEVKLAASIASLKEVTPSTELTVSVMVVTVNCELLLLLLLLLVPSKAPMLGAVEDRVTPR